MKVDKQKIKKISLYLFGLLVPYISIGLGFVLILLIPVTFYSNSNLDIKNNINSQIVYAQMGEENTIGGDVSVNFPLSKPLTPLARDNNSYDNVLTASSAFVMDVESKEVLYKKDENVVRPLASITKLMSAVTLLDFPINWSATTTILEEDGNSDQHVQLGEVYTLDNLWKSGLIGSSNKAIKALVRSVGLNKEEFVSLMNKKAQELGLKSLHFTEPTGLSSQNVGNAHDTSLLLKEALRFDKIYTTLQIKEHYARDLNKEKVRRVWSTNWLITNWIKNDFRSGYVIGKTGYIPESNYNFVSSIVNNKNQQQIIAIVLGAETNEKRFEEVRDLSEWVFDRYVWPGDKGYSELLE